MQRPASNAELSLSPEEMRALGYRVVDMLVEHVATLPEQRVAHRARRADVRARLQEPPPEQATPFAEVLDRMRDDVFGAISHVDHPRFFAFIPSPSNFVSVMAEALAAGYNVFAGTWIESAGPAEVELVVVDWLRQLCGFPEPAGGLFVSGGSVANLTALAAARHVRLGDRLDGAVVYFSDQTHSSVERALRLLGFRAGQLRKLPSDAAFRLDVAALRGAVAGDRARGLNPFCVVANAGTTNTGAVDPLEALGAFCRESGLWLHVDGAYGAAAVLCDRGRAALRGLGDADSLALDPHKWLFQPYETGCVIVRDRAWLRDTFHILPEYLRDTQGAEAVNFADYGIQLTRSFRALKLWLSLKVFGLDAFRRAVERGFVLAEAAEQMLHGMPDWEVASPAQMGILAFRYAPAGMPDDALDALNLDLIRRINDDGHAMLSSTVLRGRTVVRLCPINPRTSEADLRTTLARLDAFARQHR